MWVAFGAQGLVPSRISGLDRLVLEQLFGCLHHSLELFLQGVSFSVDFTLVTRLGLFYLETRRPAAFRYPKVASNVKECKAYLVQGKGYL